MNLKLNFKKCILSPGTPPWCKKFYTFIYFEMKASLNKYSLSLLIKLIILHKLLLAESKVWTGCEN